jgi:hypothetical protein
MILSNCGSTGVGSSSGAHAISKNPKAIIVTNDNNNFFIIILSI